MIGRADASILVSDAVSVEYCGWFEKDKKSYG